MHIGLGVVTLMALWIRPRPLGESPHLSEMALFTMLVFLGLAGRAWAAGCAGEHTRRAAIEAPRLITGGPFAYVRNPIYLASIVLGLGMVGLLGDPWMLLPYIAVFAFLYSSIVPAEEALLQQRFGENYALYRRGVGRFFPRLTPWPGAEPASFDWSAVRHEARLGAILLLIYFGLHGAAWLRSLFLRSVGISI